MKKIPWWTIAAVLAGLLLLYGQFGRFQAEGQAQPRAGFDPSTAHLVEAPPAAAPAPPGDTERRVGPSDDALEVSHAVRDAATQQRAAAPAPAPAY